jgi:hypothetical protein
MRRGGEGDAATTNIVVMPGLEPGIRSVTVATGVGVVERIAGSSAAMTTRIRLGLIRRESEQWQ